MQGISTLTQKGQVAIPKIIRDHFKLKTSDKIRFRIENDAIIAEPVSSIAQMQGIVATRKKISDQEIKQVVKQRILQKHENNS